MASVSNTARLLAKMKGKSRVNFTLGSDGLPSEIPYYIPTGCTPLDHALGGGWPGGRLIELYGDESTGKSLAALQAAANVQQMGGMVLYLDTEMTTTNQFAESVGVNMEEAAFSYPKTIEQVHQFIMEFIEAKAALDNEDGCIHPALIVWDSIAGTSSEYEVATTASQGLSKAMMGSHAAQMSKLFRVVHHEFPRAGICGLFTNQTREKIGVMFGDKTATFGGKALRFYASIRVVLATVRPYKSGGEHVGIECRARVVKNKVARPSLTCQFPIIFGKGIDDAVACFWHLESQDMLERSGSWYTLSINGTVEKFQKKGWREVFEANADYIRNLVSFANVIDDEDDSGDSDEDD